MTQKVSLTKTGTTGANYVREVELVDGRVFYGADLRGSQVDRWEFRNCDFSRACLSTGEFVSCVFQNCKFYGANLSNAKFKYCRFENCDFYCANFYTAVFDECAFVESNFEKVLSQFVFGDKETFLLDCAHASELSQAVFFDATVINTK